MSPLSRPTGTVLLLLLGSALPAGAQTAPIDSLALARRFTHWFYGGEMDSLWAHHSRDPQLNPGSTDYLQNNLEGLIEQAGGEVEVLEEKFVRRLGRTQYWRTARFSNADEPIIIRWAVTPGWEIVGMGINPKSQAPPVDP